MKTFGLLAGTLALAVAGWFVGRSVSHALNDARSDAQRTEFVAMSPQATTERAAAGGVVPPLVQRINDILERGRADDNPAEVSMHLFDEAQGMDSSEFGAAIATLAQSTDPNAAAAALSLIGLWAERDLPAALKWLEGVGHDNWAAYAGALCSTWSRTDPQALLDWFQELPDSRRTALAPRISGELAAVMGTIDPSAGLELLAALPPSAQNSEDYKTLFSTWAAKDPAAAGTRALALPAGAARSAAVEAIALAWGRSNPGAARSWIDALPDAALVGRAQAAYAIGLSDRDPKAAADYVGALPPTKPNLLAMEAIADRWMRRDSSAALAWSDALTDRDMRGKLQNTMLEVLAATDPDLAAKAYVERAVDLNTGVLGPSSLFTITRSVFANGGVDALLKFASDVPGRDRDLTYITGFTQWTQSDPEAVATWALQQPDGKARFFANKQLAVTKDRTDPAGALTWAMTLPAGKSSDGALLTVAASAFFRNPSESATLYQRVTDRAAAQESLESVISGWLMKEPAEARAWLQQSTMLSPEVRERLRKADELYEWGRKRGAIK
jgi:hypothetical protein